MYNLLVSGHSESWEGTAFDVPAGRVLREFTDDYLTTRFASLDEDAIAQLTSFPALFAYEPFHKKPARIGQITRIQPRGAAARIQFALEPAFPPIETAGLLHIAAELDIINWEMNRTHWALKDVDLMLVLLKAGFIANNEIQTLHLEPFLPINESVETLEQIEVRPTIFCIPEAERDPDLVSVMMPFGAGFKSVYQAIAEACDNAKLRCQRADDIWEETEVIQEIFSLIYRSAIVVCDFTGQNPNVFYEAGIAHTLGRSVVPITQVKDHIPFDLQHHRFLQYLDNDEGRLDLKQKLTQRLGTLRRQRQA
jgi:hypothetical protein